MELETFGAKVYLCNEARVIHVPGTLYLNEKYRNPHTKAVYSKAVRAWIRLADAFEIDLAARALTGDWLKEVEKKALKFLAFRPIEEIESLSDGAVKSIASAKRGTEAGTEDDPAKRSGAVAHNTAAQLLEGIAEFLKWFYEKVLEPRLPSGSHTTSALRHKVEATNDELKRAIRRTKSDHPQSIRSVPTERFLQIYSALYLQANKIFRTPDGKVSTTAQRDRAIALLAGEGLRPGAIGNIALEDFTWEGSNAPGYLRIKDNTLRRGSSPSVATPVQKGARSHRSYNSEYVVTIWPTTADAIADYVNGERKTVLLRGLKNRSNGFLFIADHGGPIGDRSTINYIFSRAGRGLAELGLLTRVPGDPYLEGEAYEFTAYLLRHSSASLFYAMKSEEMKDEVVEDLMRDRFGWTTESSMPRLYARRAMTDASSLTVGDFMSELLQAARAAKTADRATR